MPKRAGFTLIELLVVVAIIALLVSILIPSLTQAKDLARMAICQSNLHHIAFAYVFYVEDHNNYMPPAYHYSGDGTPGHQVGRTWAFLISEYAKGTKSDPYVGRFYSGQGPAEEHTLFHCPSEPLHGGPVLRDGYDFQIYGDIREDFAPNVHRCGRAGFPWGNYYGIGGWTRYDTLALKNGALAAHEQKQEYFGSHSETFMLGEGNYMDLEPGYYYHEGKVGMAFRHLKGQVADMVFFDGHVAPWRWPDPLNGYPEDEHGGMWNNLPFEVPW